MRVSPPPQKKKLTHLDNHGLASAFVPVLTSQSPSALPLLHPCPRSPAGTEWTPWIKRTAATASSRALLNFGGVLRGKFARQYEIEFGDDGRCEGLMRKGGVQLGFGLDYEQEVAKTYDEDVDVTCYLPELEAGRYNYTVLVNHKSPGVIRGDKNDAGTKPFEESVEVRARQNRPLNEMDGLGAARFVDGTVSTNYPTGFIIIIIPLHERSGVGCSDPPVTWRPHGNPCYRLRSPCCLGWKQAYPPPAIYADVRNSDGGRMH